MLTANTINAQTTINASIATGNAIVDGVELRAGLVHPVVFAVRPPVQLPPKRSVVRVMMSRRRPQMRTTNRYSASHWRCGWSMRHAGAGRCCGLGRSLN